MTRLLVAAPAAALSGVLIGLAFAPVGIWPAAIFGVAALCWVIIVHGRKGALLGYLAGLGLNAVTISWIGVLGSYVAVALIAFMSLWFALLGWGVQRLRRLPAWPLWVAAAWAGVELGAANVPLGGFGWNRLAFTTPDQPQAGFLPYIGVAGVSFLVALSGTALAQAAMQRPTAIRNLVAVAVTFALGAGLRAIPLPAPSQVINIGMVQGNVDGVGHGNIGYAQSVTYNHMSETITLMAKARTGQIPMPDFILWPENSTDMDPTTSGATRQLIETAASIAGRPIFVGAVMDGPGADERQTTGLWWEPARGPIARYDKRNLVPFGEWIPFRDVLLPRMPILKQIGRQGIPGHLPGVIQVDLPNHKGLRIGDIICFELAYDRTVYDTVLHRGQILVVQSNNATYTATGQPHQQFEINRVRAMELQREMVVATTSSFSALVLPDGSVVGKTSESTSASNTFSVPIRNNQTLAVKLYPWLPAALVLAGLMGIGLSYARRFTLGQAARLP